MSEHDERHDITGPASAVLVPPGAADIHEALRMLRLPFELQPAAAAHLATPTTVAVGIHVRGTQDGSWSLRDTVVHETPDPAVFAHQLAAASHRQEDRFLDLAGDPSRWVKPVRSGASQLLCGTDLLFRMPRVHADPSVPSGDLFRFVAAWITEPDFELPAVRPGRQGPVLFSGNERRVQVTHAR